MHIISTLQHNKLFSDCILLSLLTIILNQTYTQNVFYLVTDRQGNGYMGQRILLA